MIKPTSLLHPIISEFVRNHYVDNTGKRLMIQTNVCMPLGKGDKKGKDSKGKKKDSKEDKSPAIVSVP